MHLRRTAVVIAFLAAPTIAAGPIRLDVDASDVSRQIVHVHENITVTPGQLTLALPRWLPGYHGPDGKVVNLVDLHITVPHAKADLDWQRDAIERDQFHVVVPEPATSVGVTFDFLIDGDSGSRDLAVIEWNNFILYPIPSKMTELQVAAQITLPPGWDYASALRVGQSSQLPRDTAVFATTSLMTLIDSPLFAGKYHKSFDVGPVSGVAHSIEAFADSAKALEMSDAMLAAHKRLPQEAFALFGTQHYSRYQWLVAIAGSLSNGIEHHESSDNRCDANSLSDDTQKPGFSYLLSHEYVHSWNGKFRRPVGMVVDDFQQPIKTDLLWVYEGMTQYWGLVLATRCGAWSFDDFRDELAGYYDAMVQRTGRAWRPLRDVALDASNLYGVPPENSARRRSSGDFYVEGTLLWLEADVKIRNLTDGKRSLDDFAQRFYGGTGGKASVETYTLDDVVKTMNDVAPYDWATFFHDRIDVRTKTPPGGGFTEGGYAFGYSPTMTPFQEKRASARHTINAAASIGASVDPDSGNINDVIPGSPADQIAVPVGGKIIGVNGMKFSGDRLKEAIAGTKETPLELIVEQRDRLTTFKIDYNGGAKNAMLTRDAAKPDRLAEIAKAKVAPPTTQATTKP